MTLADAVEEFDYDEGRIDHLEVTRPDFDDVDVRNADDEAADRLETDCVAATDTHELLKQWRPAYVPTDDDLEAVRTAQADFAYEREMALPPEEDEDG